MVVIVVILVIIVTFVTLITKIIFMKVFKTYNLKLTKSNHFKIEKIITELEKKRGKKPTKSEVINAIIRDSEIKDTAQIDMFEN